MTGWSVVDSESARDYFTRYGAATIVLGRFFTSVRAIAWPDGRRTTASGYPTFLALDLVAATLWASLWVVLGWMVGERWEWRGEDGRVLRSRSRAASSSWFSPCPWRRGSIDGGERAGVARPHSRAVTPAVPYTPIRP